MTTLLLFLLLALYVFFAPALLAAALSIAFRMIDVFVYLVMGGAAFAAGYFSAAAFGLAERPSVFLGAATVVVAPLCWSLFRWFRLRHQPEWQRNYHQQRDEDWRNFWN